MSNEKKNIIKEPKSEMIQHDFTDKELQEKANALARSCQAKRQVEDEKKQVMSDYKAKIDAKDAEIGLLSTHISNGWEMRRVEGVWHKNFETGRKQFIVGGISVLDQELTADDHQVKLELNEPPKE